MEPAVSTSFIPKRPITSATAAAPRTRSRSIGLLSFIAVIAVIGTALAYAGVYLYERSLDSQRQTIAASIEEARGGIGSDFLAEMKRLNARIDGVKQLIANHIVISPIFAALEQSTLRSVQYKSFSYEFASDPATRSSVVRVALAGAAKSYSAIALQSDAFAQNQIIRNPVFSGLTVDDRTGTISFRLSFTVAAEDLSYQRFIDAKTAAVSVPVVPAQAPQSAGVPSTP